ncbi:tail fiber domain-containing protein [Pseudofulvibacter geojedonensis]|uniref:Tail fiber domain-containing protein n=1 Tax=Pseudofulvibacter geojedonensis TaxID=1123758 RepID=A0ABW3I522_9FLAO
MKTLHSILLVTLICISTYAQVGIGTTTPDNSSILHLQSTDSGLLIPRLTYGQKLLINSPATGLLIYQTNNEDGFWYYDGTQWLPFKTTYTFNNGLTASGNNAQLGGTLIQETTIDLGNHDFILETSSTSSYPGDFEIKGNDRTILKTALNENYIHFGDNFPYLGTSVDGTTLTTIGGDNYTIDVVAGFQSNSQIGGSSIKLGSVEYLMDGIDEIYLDADAGFHPREDQTSSFGASLGSSSKRWARLYANDGVIQTSDMRYKNNVKPLKYGLKELLQLNTFTYNWIENKIQKKQKQETKIGVSAQELLEVIPEVVKTHSWVPLDEKGNYKLVKNKKLGVNYSELIPVLINSIKELNKEIEILKQK